MRAALIAAGPTAVLSHRSAAALWKLIPSPPPFIDVTVTRRGPRTRPGLVVHATRIAPEVRTQDSPSTHNAVENSGRPGADPALTRALFRKIVTREQVDAARIIDPGLAAPTRSSFERTFRAALRKAGLPPPVTGHPIPPYTADFAWPEERVVVETDGWESHGTRIAFEDDRARDAFLAARGWIRITWRRLKNTLMLVMVALAQTLARRTPTLQRGTI